jgi:predicted nucleotidyltransferase/DNA-binding Xre family transcriptional regulator
MDRNYHMKMLFRVEKRVYVDVFFTKFDKNCQTLSDQMQAFGDKLRTIRTSRALSLSDIAEKSGIDKAVLSKIETGKRGATHDQVLMLCKFLGLAEKELLLPWLSDKILETMKGEKYAQEALKLAEQAFAYQSEREEESLSAIVNQIYDFLRDKPMVDKAWVFGSYARNEQTAGSDLDIMIEIADKARCSLYDLIGIQHELEAQLHRKIDLVERGFLKPWAAERVEEEKILVYDKNTKRYRKTKTHS